MRARMKKTSLVIKTLSATILISITLYSIERQKNFSVSLTDEERLEIFKIALELKRQPLEWNVAKRENLEMTESVYHTKFFLPKVRDPRRRLQVPIPDYNYNTGNCPEKGSRGIPCAPSTLSDSCQKGNGKLSRCLLDCLVSFCCIHDIPEQANPYAPSCNDDENCAQYAPCYIAWWKLQDTVGPATEFNLDQNDDFFDVDILQDVTTDLEFYQELLFHHFTNIEPILELAADEEIKIADIFAKSEIWDAESAIVKNKTPENVVEYPVEIVVSQPAANVSSIEGDT